MLRSLCIRPARSRTGNLALTCGAGTFGGFLFGFDTAVISGTIGPLERQFELSAALLGWTVSSALLGSVIGAGLAGHLSDRLGRKISLAAAGALFLISAVGSAVAPSLGYLIAARLLGGVGVGLAGMAAPLYVAEVSPPTVRGRMVSLYQLAIATGVLAAYLSNAGIQRLSASAATSGGTNALAEEVWRGMFGAEIFPAALFCTLLAFIPESPRFLAKRGAYDAAERVLRLFSEPAAAKAECLEIRDALASDSGRFRDLFGRRFGKPTFIALYLAVFSQLSGVDVVIYYGPKIFEEAGSSFGSALSGQVVLGIILVLFTLVALWKVDSAGRRRLLYWGNSGVAIALAAIGLFFHWGIEGGIWLTLAISSFIASFAFSLGPVPWIVAAEIFPTKLRGRAMAVATMVLFGTTGLLGQLFPSMLESIGPAGTFWLLASLALPTFAFTWKVLPETKGRTLEQIEQAW